MDDKRVTQKDVNAMIDQYGESAVVQAALSIADEKLVEQADRIAQLEAALREARQALEEGDQYNKSAAIAKIDEVLK